MYCFCQQLSTLVRAFDEDGSGQLAVHAFAKALQVLVVIVTDRGMNT